MTHWQHGMLVVCIGDEWNWDGLHSIGPEVPKPGRLYTVDDIAHDETIAGGVGLGFAEEGVCRDWWPARNFRPVDETKILPFRAHLALDRQGGVEA